MDGDRSCFESLEGMGVFALTREAVKIIRRNVYLFLSFVTNFTIPCSLFTIFWLSAIDVHHRYVLADFIAPGELVIFRWKFQTLISPLSLNLAFILLNLLPVATLNTIVTTRGVVSIYRNQDLTTSIKNGYLNIHRAVLRLLATQSILYFSYLVIFALSLLLDTSTTTSPDAPISTASSTAPTTLLLRTFLAVFVLFFFHLPVSQVAVLEGRSYGFRGVYRAVKVACGKAATWAGLGAFSLVYFCLLKALVDVLLRDSYPYWTKFVAYPPLVVGVIAMSVFWQVVYTLFYLSSVQVDQEKADASATGGRREDGVDDRPLLADEVDERSEGNSNSQYGVV